VTQSHLIPLLHGSSAGSEIQIREYQYDRSARKSSRTVPNRQYAASAHHMAVHCAKCVAVTDESVRQSSHEYSKYERFAIKGHRGCASAGVKRRPALHRDRCCRRNRSVGPARPDSWCYSKTREFPESAKQRFVSVIFYHSEHNTCTDHKAAQDCRSVACRRVQTA
jgi:hypothetical protein